MSDTRTASWPQYLAIFAVPLALIVAGYFGFSMFRNSPTQPSVDVGRTIAEEFLTTVRGGNPGKAWDTSTAEFKSIEGRESFIRKVRATPILKEPLQFNSSQQVMLQDEPRTEYLFQSPQAKLVRVLIGNEQGSWKVDRLTM